MSSRIFGGTTIWYYVSTTLVRALTLTELPPMPIKNTPTHYGAITKLLHWSIAVLIIGLTGLGIYMVDLTYYDRYYNVSLETHKALGILVLELAIIKILWSACSTSPVPAAGLKPWEKLAAKLMHLTLYAMMVLIPLSGYAISTSDGKTVSFFGWYEVPAWLPPIENLNQTASEVHYYLAYITIGLVSLHFAAALKHQLIDKDGTLRKMI